MLATVENRRFAPCSLALAAILACTSSSPTGNDDPVTPAKPQPAPPTMVTKPDVGPVPSNAPVVELAECCASYADVKRLDGARVRLHGVYKRTVVSKRHAKRGEPTPPPDLDTPGTVVIRSEGAGVMLEVYYNAEGMRSAEESKQFHGKRVEVVGVLHQATPTQLHEGQPMQTMINPYIGAIESIRLLPTP